MDDLKLSDIAWVVAFVLVAIAATGGIPGK